MSVAMSWNQLTLFAEDSPASPSPSQGSGKRRKTRAGSGRSLPVSFARFDPASSSWRTCPASAAGAWATYSATWPRAGMTRNGTAYQRAPLVRLTRGTVSGSWPTPVRADGERASETYKRGNPTLLGAVLRWQTPTVQDAKNNGGPGQHSENTVPLNAQVGGKLNPQWVEWLMGFPTGWSDLEDSATP